MASLQRKWSVAQGGTTSERIPATLMPFLPRIARDYENFS